MNFEPTLDSLSLLKENNSSIDTGTLSIRTMLPTDLVDGIRLSKLANWNQKLADWELFYQLNPAGCFVVTHNDKVVGTVATVNYNGEVSWISMVLVDLEMRRMGIGALLLKTAINYLSICKCIKLDATPAGKKVYDKLGFKDEYKLSRLTIKSMPCFKTKGTIGKIIKSDLKKIKEYDASSFGVDRSEAIAGFAKLAPKYGFVAKNKKGEISGFILGRSGKNFEQLGPLMADDLKTAQSLLTRTSLTLDGKPALIDVSLSNKQWVDWLIGLGFIEERQFIRMYLKENSYIGNHKQVWAISGPELG